MQLNYIVRQTLQKESVDFSKDVVKNLVWVEGEQRFTKTIWISLIMIDQQKTTLINT